MDWGGMGLAYGVGLYACIRAYSCVCARSDLYPHENRHGRGVHTGVWVMGHCNDC